MTAEQTIRCPYCGEQFDTVIDLSAGSQDYIEDCQVCCRPITFLLRIEQGELRSLTVRRDDD